MVRPWFLEDSKRSKQALLSTLMSMHSFHVWHLLTGTLGNHFFPFSTVEFKSGSGWVLVLATCSMLGAIFAIHHLSPNHPMQLNEKRKKTADLTKRTRRVWGCALGFVYAAQRQRSLLSLSFFYSLGSRSRTVPTDTTGHDRISTLPFQLQSFHPHVLAKFFSSSSPLHHTVPLLCFSFSFLRFLPFISGHPIAQCLQFRVGGSLAHHRCLCPLTMVAREVDKNNLHTNQLTLGKWLVKDNKTTNDDTKKIIRRDLVFIRAWSLMVGMRLHQHPGGDVVFLALLEIHNAVIQSWMLYGGSKEGEIKMTSGHSRTHKRRLFGYRCSTGRKGTLGLLHVSLHLPSGP